MNLDLVKEIKKLKAEKQAVLLVHNYQIEAIQLLADFLGDSLGLSRQATQIKKPLIVFCGVLFMAETAKILSPEKTVLLPRKDAGCPMAEMADVEGLKKLKAKHPDAMVVTYVNSTAEVKAESNVCCTSANAIQVVQNVEANQIIFAPDRNLAAYVQRFTNKLIIPWHGYCYVHVRFTKEEVLRSREIHPDALIMVHPECSPEVIDLADEVQSTSGMIRVASECPAKKFLIGTEEGLIHRLKRENPNKSFYSIGSAKVCRGMKVTQLDDLYQSLSRKQYSVEIDETIMTRARQALERMLRYV
jgi:quinolinate synthase